MLNLSLSAPMTPDLTGSVIVLTHPRTGSSLVMQTLHLLGVAIVGERERHDLPAGANPKGYFEDKDVLRVGLAAPALRGRPDLLRGRAVKVALSPLVRRGDPAEWDALAVREAALLFPIRSPPETFLSRGVLLRGQTGFAAHSRLFRASVRGYLRDVGFLAARLSSAAYAGSPPACIDYRLAIDDPPEYVSAVAEAAGIEPSSSQRAAAAANVDRGLYRHRVDSDAVRFAAAGLGPLEAVHEVLRSQDPGKWKRLRAMLPAWVFAELGLA